jgi:phosphohistidine phosphatase SixA
MSKTVTYIRHFKQISHKNTDSEINTRTLPNPIPTFEYDLILCSPYLRCRQTANLINTQNKPIVIDSNLSEYQGHKNLKELRLTPSTKQHEIPSLNET